MIESHDIKEIEFGGPATYRIWSIPTFRPYMQVIGEYLKSLEQYPNPRGISLTKFGRQ